MQRCQGSRAGRGPGLRRQVPPPGRRTRCRWRRRCGIHRQQGTRAEVGPHGDARLASTFGENHVLRCPGLVPCSADRYRRYGGNTSCVLVEVDGEPPLIIDLGTGLRALGSTSGHPWRPSWHRPGGQCAPLPSALRPRDGPALLRPDAPRRVHPRRLRPRPGRWSGTDPGLHGPAAVLSGQPGRVPRDVPLPRARGVRRVRHRRHQGQGPADPATSAVLSASGSRSTTRCWPTCRTIRHRSTSAR